MNKKMVMVLAMAGGMCAILSAQVLGRIDYMEGKVEVTRDGSVLASVDIGTPIENLDLVRTSADGLATISFDKKSGLTGTLQIVPDTSAVIRQQQLSGTSANEVQLLAGSVNLKVKRLAGVKSSVQVRSPTAVLGVRGTEFVVSSFNGSSIVACKEGEVFCTTYSAASSTNSSRGTSSVPGTMVEILESGSLNSGAFPPGNFEENWNAVQKKWKNFNIDLIVQNPMPLIDQFASSWNLYSGKLEAGAAKLRSNAVLQKWMKVKGTPSGSYGEWVKEKPAVMRDLIDIRPDVVMSMMLWYRLQDLVPYLPESAMNRTLSSGQTVKSFLAQYKRSSKAVSDAVALFHAAEKQYMLRNDGESPFSEF